MAYVANLFYRHAVAMLQCADLAENARARRFEPSASICFPSRVRQ
jgi:hypothetical protein